MKKQLGPVMAALVLVACSGEVVDQTTGGAGAGTNSTVSAGSGGAVPCVPQEPGAGVGFQQPTCADLAGMTVSDPVVKDDGGDGTLSPGEAATITVQLNEVAGTGFYHYPSVAFFSDVAGVTATSDAQFYGISACQSMESPGRITVAGTVPKGTKVNIKAQVSMLNADCPDAYSITVPITIQ